MHKNTFFNQSAYSFESAFYKTAFYIPFHKVLFNFPLVRNEQTGFRLPPSLSQMGYIIHTHLRWCDSGYDAIEKLCVLLLSISINSCQKGTDENIALERCVE